MKEDGETSARPSLMRIQAHANDVTKDHHAKIERPKYQETCPQPPAGFREITVSTGEVKTDFPVKYDDQNLAGQQLRIGQENLKTTPPSGAGKRL